ncbi:M-phase inducer phosphatase 2-like [Octopus sinensis]|uniref:M-phase inducer phosphatase 2-like n=1 Tax=Octopus sinensis TaxID=2607531 RepID=A0A6P7TZ19_9MOLL|nr:M-phase inducer phosphatase 2-like [Octopus sinensis]
MPGNYENVNVTEQIINQKPTSNIEQNFYDYFPEFESLLIRKMNLYKIEFEIEPYLSVPLITPKYVLKIIRNDFGDVFRNYNIFDCRSVEEYEMGHVVGASLMSERAARKKFTLAGSNSILIFYCEFSSKRCKQIISIIQKVNTKGIREGKSLLYPNLAIIEGGYCNFYKQYPHYCDPRGYLTEQEAYRNYLMKNKF